VGGRRQDLDGVSELVDGNGVAVGPPLPRVEGDDGAREVGEPMVDGVELGGQVVVAEVGASVLDVGDGSAMALDVSAGLLPCPFEDRGRPLEYPFGDVELPARLAPATPGTAGEVTLRVVVVHAGLVGSLLVDGEELSLSSRRPVDDGQVSLSCGDGGCSSRSFDRARFDGVLGGGKGVSGVGEHVGEPVRDLATARLG
jgi:hypothetical protein